MPASNKSAKTNTSRKSKKSTASTEHEHVEQSTACIDGNMTARNAAPDLQMEVPDEITEEYEVMAEEEKRRHEAWAKMMREKLNKRQAIIDKKLAMAKEQEELSNLVLKQQLQEKEMVVQQQAEFLALKVKERELDRLEQENMKKAQELTLAPHPDHKLVPEPEMTAMEKTTGWLQTQPHFGPDTGAVPKKGTKLKTTSQAGSKASSRAGSTTSQQKIKELMDRIQQLEMEHARAAPSTGEGVSRLKTMGIMPVHLPDDQTAIPPPAMKVTDRELTKLGGTWPTEGKTQQPVLYTCCEHAQNVKTKQSGKYVKTNVNIKFQENWPHVNTLKKYCKHTTFDNLEFEAFVAGETRVILQMEDHVSARGRLKLLMLISHWLCASKDWSNIRNLYEGIVESIEMGDDTWNSDFTHYETMINKYRGDKEHTTNKEQKTDGRKKTDKLEVYWCKQFQKGKCDKKSPHLSTINASEPPVPVMHICAHCWQKENTRAEHNEQDCPSKKGQ